MMSEKHNLPLSQETETGHGNETANTFPEVFANEPLENTTYIYSVPVKGEWHNGNLRRMLRGMLSQRTRTDESFEVELIVNSGGLLKHLFVQENFEPKKDEKGNILLREVPQDEEQQSALDLLAESDEALDFVKKIIDIQYFARAYTNNPQGSTYFESMRQLVDSIEDPLERKIAQLASENAHSVSISLIDATRTVFEETDYRETSIDTFRTLGADYAKVRFEDRPDVVFGMYDADTVPENNNATRNIQEIFNEHPDLNYVFSGITNLPVGISKNFLADGPRENVRRTASYNRDAVHGSPQISFRLRSLEKLNEIAGWASTGFYGDEDRDTTIRLIYHFGDLQKGLLLESSCNVYMPTSMTADRLDGFGDSAGRLLDYAENGVQFMASSLGDVFTFKEKVMNLIESAPYKVCEEMYTELNKAREHFQKRQRVQQRFNRLVLNTFTNAVDAGYITDVEGVLSVNNEEILKQNGGEALLHYITSNENLVKQVLSSEEDLEVINYFLGKTKNLPIVDFSPFQKAIREYIGDIADIDTFTEQRILKLTRQEDAHGFVEWHGEDLRDSTSNISFMHTGVSELLAHAHVYKMYFETEEFFSSKAAPDGVFGYNWPENPDEQVIYWRRSTPQERYDLIKANAEVLGREIPKEEQPTGLLAQIRFRAIPLFELYKRLKAKGFGE